MAKPNFPTKIWDGSTPNTDRVDPLLTDQWCNHQDWDQIRAELIAVQQYVLNLPDDSGHIYVGIANESIPEGYAVCVRPDTFIEVGDNTNSTVAGVSLQAAAFGEPVLYVSGGKIVLNSWTLTPGSRYYVDSDGSLTATAPATNFLIPIGYAHTSTTLDINIQESIRM